MAIKIECSACGYQNDLGRVFCAQCGVKLDLRATSAQDFREQRRFGIGEVVRRFLPLVLLVLLLGGVGAAVWPARIPPVQVDPAGAVQVPIKAKAVRAAISYSRAATLSISEGELNGFLNERARSRMIPRLVIDLKPGAFDLYAIRNVRIPTNFVWLARFNLKFSMSMRGSFQNGVMTIEGVRFGHLPLPGFAQAPVVDFFAETFSDITREKRVVSALKTAALEETKADLVLGP